MAPIQIMLGQVVSMNLLKHCVHGNVANVVPGLVMSRAKT